MNKKQLKKQLYILMVLFIFTTYFLSSIKKNILLSNIESISINSDYFRNYAINVSFEDISLKAESLNTAPCDLLTVLCFITKCNVKEEDLNNININNYNRYKNYIIHKYRENYNEINNFICGNINDFKYFPVAASINDSPFVSYEDSWGNSRTYGGERTHEGTDIMALIKQDGLYPVLSVSEGTIKSIGWLKLGGYRIGISSPSGIYYYYAHLDSYAKDFKVGDIVKAGDIIGYMGSTGYSEVEGTKGKFDTHLHFGIYITDKDGNEISINPYHILKWNNDKLLYYNY
ncbi:MAG: M23 family metallopeptidase [Lachnospira sp.]